MVVDIQSNVSVFQNGNAIDIVELVLRSGVTVTPVIKYEVSERK